MAGLGSIFVELQLDRSKFDRSLQQLETDSTSVPLSIEKSFHNLGIKSSYEFDLLRQKAVLNYEAIKARSESTANDILRAEQAKNATITKIAQEQNSVQIGYFRQLNIRSSAEYESMRQQIAQAYQAIASSAESSAADIQRAERAKNEQLTRLQEEQFGTQKRLLGDMRGQWVNTAVAIATAWAGIKIAQFASDVLTTAARTETLGVAMAQMGKNAGYTQETLTQYENAMKQLGITTQESRSSLMQMMQANLSLEQSARLARTAQDLAVNAGINSSEALQRMLHGIVTLQPEVLRTIGLAVNFESEYKKVADQTGRTMEALSQQEKQQIALNLVMREGAKYAGNYEAAMGTAGKAMTSLARFQEEAKNALGTGLLPSFKTGIDLATGLLKAFNALPPALQEIAGAATLATAAFVAFEGVVVGLTAAGILGAGAAALFAPWVAGAVAIAAAAALAQSSGQKLKAQMPTAEAMAGGAGYVTGIEEATSRMTDAERRMLLAGISSADIEARRTQIAKQAQADAEAREAGLIKYKENVAKVEAEIAGLRAKGERDALVRIELERTAALAKAKADYEADLKTFGMTAEGKALAERHYAALRNAANSEAASSRLKIEQDNAKQLLEIQGRILTVGLDGDAKELQALQNKHAQELDQLRRNNAAAAQISEVQRLQRLETGDLIARQERDQADRSMAVLIEYWDRRGAIGMTGTEKELAALDAKHRQEIEKLRKAKIDEAAIEEAARIQKLERDAVARQQFIDAETAMLRTEAILRTAAVQAEVGFQQQALALRQRLGQISDREAIEIRYSGERRILEAKQQQLERDLSLSSNAAEIVRLQGEIAAVQKQITDSKTLEYYEIDLNRKTTLQEILALQQQSYDLQVKGYEAAYQNLFDMANQVGGEAGKGLGMFAAGMKSITDIAAGTDPYEQELQRAIAHYDQMRELYRQEKISEAQINAEYDQLMVTRDRTMEQQKVAMYQNTAAMGAGAMLALYNLTGQKHTEMFRAFQALSIAEALINTYKAAVGAYSAMASIPYVGPVLGAAAAAAAIAFGMAQVAAIASMKPGGGGAATAAAPPSGGGYSYVQPTTPTWQQTQPAEETKRPISIQIHIAGNVVDHDAFARELVPSITKAIQDGVQ